MIALPEETNRRIRLGRWAAIATFAVLWSSQGIRRTPIEPVAMVLVGALVLVNLVEAGLIPSLRARLVGPRWYLNVIGLEVAVAATQVAALQDDQRFGVWAGLILPLLHCAARYGVRGVMVLWVPSSLVLAGLELRGGASAGPWIYQSAMLLLLAWSIGRLAMQLTERNSSVRGLQLVVRTAQQVVSLDAAAAIGLVTQTAGELGVSDLAVVWRLPPDRQWNFSGDPVPAQGLQEWADGVTANLGSERGLVQLSRAWSATLTHDLRGTEPIVMAGRFEEEVPLLLVAQPERVLSQREVDLLEVLLHHAAERLIAIGQQQQADLREQHLTQHDPLTKLPNRARLTHEVDRALRAHHELDGSTAVLLFDLDRFKEINDTFGHEQGDRLLVQVADRMRATLREGDVLARLGGDEFVVLMASITDPAQAVRTAERLIAEVNRPMPVGGISLHVESSVGIAVSPGHGTTAYDLLRCADIAMYEAKRNQLGIAVYDPSADRHTPDRLTLLADLREALTRIDQLNLHYQPMVGLETGRVVAAEALLRWNHPERGMVMPNDFIPLAESTGLIHTMTLYVLDHAARQLALWQEAGLELSVAVNVSTRSLLDEEFPDTVMDTLRRHGVDPRRMRLEITESTIMEDPVRAVETLIRLSEYGIKLSIDDFGTGHSSLSYLKQLPVDELKVDRTFVMDLMSNEDDAVLVQAVVDLGHNLGLHVVAEGVEDAETLRTLSGLGCDVAQGFHLSRPIPARQATEWIRAWNRDVPAQRGRSESVPEERGAGGEQGEGGAPSSRLRHRTTGRP